MEARISAIKGNTVLARGLEEASMGNLVQLGEIGAFGEIISISGKIATIQAYEDTNGLRINDIVKDLKSPLMIELGPGLLSNIFDGLGRRLDLIQSNFIVRGAPIITLDRSKKWGFKPLKKNGDAVVGGDIIGEVQETDLIETKIMVPPEMKGKLVEIGEGEFTVNQKVAAIETADGKRVDITMAQVWPIRKRRPVAGKLNVYEPLITGQRVFDAFFPLHMGGSATLPGGFGVGKCVTGDTFVFCADGILRRIEDIYRNADRIAVENGKNEEFIKTSGQGLFSLENGRIAKSGSDTFYKGKSDTVFRIQTRTGRSVRVTPAHKLFRINEEGDIMETPAKDLKVGDFIASVRKIDVHNEDAKIDIYKLGNEKIIDRATRDAVRVAAKTAMKSGIEPDLPNWALCGVRNSDIMPKLSWVKALYAALGWPLPQPKLIGRFQAKGTHIPERMSIELAEFLGYYVSEGYIRGSAAVVFTNLDEGLLDRFVCLTRELFGLPAKKEYQKNKAPNVLVHSKALVDFLKSENAGKTAREKHIPESVLKSSNDALASFLTAYYLGDGSMSKRTIELCTASRPLQLELSYALARFGILHSLKTKMTNGVEYYRIFIASLNELSRFYSVMKARTQKTLQIINYVNSKRRGYTGLDIVPVASDVFKRAYEGVVGKSELLRNGVDIDNYAVLKERMSTNTFKRFVRCMVTANGNQLQMFDRTLSSLAEALDYIFCDRITEIVEETGPFDVYDFSLPKNGKNFIGGFGGIVLHNTVEEQSFSKFSNTDISIYVGCGERGNEMADVLNSFPSIIDPRSGKSIMGKTVLLANTSNMPIIARESSIFTGITIAEFYRDMGYSVLLTADSTSRWAEALRELGSELGEMPVEEGFPASLFSSLASFYSRAGIVRPLGSDERTGSVTIVSAVSPPGGDFSEPVTQTTTRLVDALWELDNKLAGIRHYPAINWTDSYSLTVGNLKDYYEKEVGKQFSVYAKGILDLLHASDKINEIASIVGRDALPDKQAATLQLADTVKLYFLQQNAYDKEDAYTDIKTTYKMMEILFKFIGTVNSMLDSGVKFSTFKNDAIWEKMADLKHSTQLDSLEKMVDSIASSKRAT